MRNPTLRRAHPESRLVAARGAAATCLVLACGCGAESAPVTAQDLGRLSVRMSGASVPGNGQGRDLGLSAAMVRIDRVTAHSSSVGWVVLRDSIDVEVDVLRLPEHAQALGFADLPAGRVNQIRLHVSGNHAPFVTTASGAQVPMKVPSGEQSGIKVKGTFEVEACADTEVDVTLDGKKSIWIHPTGHEDLYVLRPVIRAGHVVVAGACDDDPAPSQEPGGGDPVTGGDPNVGGEGGVPPGAVDDQGEPVAEPPPSGEPPAGEPNGGACTANSDCNLSAACVNGICVAL